MNAPVSDEALPGRGRYDVVVCGGGPAGIGAATAAARAGASTLLIERRCHLGGMAASAFVNTFGDTVEGPVFTDLVRRLHSLGAGQYRMTPERFHRPGRFAFDGEMLKAIALEMLRDAGAHVLFDAVATAAHVTDDTVSGVLVADAGGSSLVRAGAVVDATADGSIAASAGAPFDVGDPDDGRLMHVNFRFELDGVDWNEFRRSLPAEDEILERIRGARSRGELRPPPGVFHPGEETFPYDTRQKKLVLSGWEIAGVDCSDPVQVNDTLVACQLAALDVVRFARAHLPGCENAQIARLPDALGTRESRRIRGDYTLAKEDVIGARTFDDAVARGSFWCDFHDSPPGTTIPYELSYVNSHRPAEGDWYDVPYRALLPAGVDGILTAGRCISCDRWALASLRVMPTCMYTGTAAGAAAALAARRGMPPRAIPAADVREAIDGIS